MTYLVLARKWRPRSFDTLVGQDHVVRALTHALSTQRLHHAWLFTGTRGVGKTTLSRILAKSLNCIKGITPEPCGVCQACTEIDSGRFVDYIELDAASNRGVDEMTQLLDQAVYAPSSGRFKVYMIDEVHMLSGHAFNAMLKTLEEPPPHVKFILATTDPQKIPVTVLSRCLQFNLKQMAAGSIVSYLESVLAQEEIPFEVPALRLLAQAASGSMRDALSLTDQAIAYSAGNMTAESIQGMLGAIDQRHLVALLQALCAGQATQVLDVANQLAERGLSYSGALADLAVLLSRIAIEQRVPGTVPPDDPQSEDIARLAQELHPDQLQLFYSVAVHSRNELSLAPDEYAGFVMACLRMLSLVPAAAQATPSSSPPANDATPTPEVKPEAVAASAPIPAAAPVAEATPIPKAALVTEATQAPEAALTPDPAPALIPASAPSSASASALDPAPVTDPAPTPVAAALPVTPKPTPAPAPAPVVAAPNEPAQDEIPAWEEQPANSEFETMSVAASGAGQDNVVSESAVPDSATHTVSESPASIDASTQTSLEESTPPQGADDEPTDYDSDGRFQRVDALDLDSDPVLPDEVVETLTPPVFSTGRKKTKAPKLRSMTSQAWPALVASLPLTGIAAGLAAELARQSEWVDVQGDTINLRVAVRTLAEGPGITRLQTLLSEHFGTVIQLHVQYGATGDETAHAVALAHKAERQKQAESAAELDPFVQSLVAGFGARIVPGSISATPMAAG